ncbi:HNH endonuclease signature motif containing protein [Tessaracoccus lacteus]|uniref:DUF222 domain-containing protein n=1 Tax=Tessaracoccus lacteus TaxID=3041766 RepID=A0ABY8Q1T3_9ACTN|nr:HNH endonuclease signature motif containing protein [Tessaracoccus sp. T21]WGT48337.1 DUF222 domain-containing protein [Tessaracoccus sp. T21]
MAGGGMVAGLEEYLDGALEELSALRSHDDDAVALVEIAAVLDRFGERLQALRVDVIRRADLVADEHTDVKILVHASNFMTQAEAGAQVNLARALERLPLLRDAWRAGTLSRAQAQGILRGLKQVPVALGPALLERAQEELLAWVGQLDPKGLEVLAASLGDLLVPELAEERERERVERDARMARDRRELMLASDHHGSMTIRGRVPIAVGEAFRAQLQALVPTSQSYREAHETPPSMAARTADALEAWTSIVSGVDKDAMPSRGGDRPTLYVTVSEEGLLARDAQARLLDDQTRLDAPETRRIACDARLARLVFSAEGAIVDLGQSRRLFTGPLRRALAARDRGCAFPGCDMPAVACEGHHIVPWQSGGSTCLDNAALLCPRHHRLVEPDPGRPAHLQWQVRLDPETRLPVFIPPSGGGEEEKPHLHHRFLRRYQPPPGDGEVEPSDQRPTGRAASPPTRQGRGAPGCWGTSAPASQRTGAPRY